MIKDRRCLLLEDLYSNNILVLKMDKIISRYNQYVEQINTEFDLEQILTPRRNDSRLVIHEKTFKKVQQGKGVHCTHELIFRYLMEHEKELFEHLVIIGNKDDSNATCYLLKIDGLTVPRGRYHKQISLEERKYLDLMKKGMLTIRGSTLKELSGNLITYVLKMAEELEDKKGGNKNGNG